MCVDIDHLDKMKTATAKVRWYNAKHRKEMWTCFQGKFYEVCIARAAVNESVCEETLAECSCVEHV